MPAIHSTPIPLTTPDLFRQLRRRFEPMLSLALATSRRAEHGERIDFAATAAAMDGLADTEAHRAHDTLFTPEQLQACRLAAYTFADELLLAIPGGQWFEHGLQLRRLARTDGGTTFFAAMQRMAEQAGQEEDADDILLLSSPVQPAAHAPAPPVARPGHAPAACAAHPAEGCQDILKLARTVQALAGSTDTGTADPASAACAFMAMCLLFGFRGCLYAPERAAELDALLSASAALVQRCLPQGTHSTPAAQEHNSVCGGLAGRLHHYGRPALLLLFLSPVLVTAIWYLVCAGIINTLSLPWSG